MEVAEEGARTNLLKKKKANKKQKQDREGGGGESKMNEILFVHEWRRTESLPPLLRGKRRLYARENKPRAGHPFMARDHDHCVEASWTVEEAEGGLGSDVGYTWLDTM